ncbi:MAG: LacI family transcriptional regulator [Verrucomicrobia bacterium]|nr:LacI family transcriptional regulator [Verrucomicrobiota bacterium]MBU4247128.1 LacI family transcriptional regulator [Verrucomicrobiota bacterium]MBU4430272.1 LacI family transcriptional regulator [Verrucomicrobiota bacterium]MCG2680591.1 LacI family transcriptional regulator [Kiritimatiellia bacterium]
MSIKLKDVAKQANVTLTTASLVLNNRTSLVPVSEKTRQRVLLAASQLNYHPNYAARSLRTRRTFTIGVVANSPRNQWHMLDAAEQIAEAKGFELLVTISRWNVDAEENTLRRLLNRRVDGILILGPTIESANRQELESLATDNYPVVGIGPMVTKGIDYVDFDRTAALQNLTEHLLAQRCRSFVFLESVDTPGCRALVAGIEAALKGNSGVSFTPLKLSPINSSLSLAQMSEAITSFLKTNRPDAVICRADEWALVVIRAAERAGIAVPGHMAVTGSGDTPLGAGLHPPLTTLKIPHEIMVQVAMDRLIDRITNPTVPRERLAKLIPAELVIRQSCRFKPAQPGNSIVKITEGGTTP